MKTRRILPTLAVLFICLSAQAKADDSVFEKTFAQRFSSIAIENSNGRTEVETWNSNRVRVTATRQPGRAADIPLEVLLRFQIVDTDLRIVVRGERIENPIRLQIFVPRQVNLAVKGETEMIAIRGITDSLTVETESGAISLYLPKSANTDLSLRSIEGTITSQMDMRLFGPV